MENAEKITVEVTVNAPLERVWASFTEPKHIMQWSFAADDWHTPKAENDLSIGGKFTNKMAAKDGSFSFDFSGTYTNVKEHELIAYSLEDGRNVEIVFAEDAEGTKVTETFDPETQNSAEMQQAGWQSILNNFKKHVEAD